MSVNELIAPPHVSLAPRDLRKRTARWNYFRVMFVFTYLGVVADIFTTARGFQKIGAAYEQNPLGAALISHLGWPGLFAFLTLLAAVAFVSCRTVYWKMAPVWAILLNVALFLMATIRWLVVALAILFST